jgi:hypothetical protein
VQRAEGQVSRLGDSQRRLGGLQIAQLADENDVRIFAQRGAQRLRKPVRIGVQFALVHQTALVLVDVLDRILNRQNVLVPLVVDLVEHRRERGRLAASCRSRHEHQPARPLGQRGQDRRQVELFECFDLLWNQSIDGAHGAALVEDVRSEAGHTADAKRKIELERLLEPFLLGVGHDAVRELLGLCRRQFRQGEPLQLSMDAHLRRRVGRQVEVRSPQVHGHLEQFR